MFPGAFRAEHPDRPALLMADGSFRQSYAELDDAANRLSRALRDAGLAPGDHVAICLENHPRYLEVLWGCHYAGLVYTAISSRLTSDELAYVIDDCGAKAFITSRAKAAQAAEVRGRIPNVTSRLMLDASIEGFESYEAMVARAAGEPLVDRVAGTDMLYSSGTTGQPKGVTLEFQPRPLVETPTPVTGLAQLLFGFDRATVYLSPAPLYHAAPLRFSMAVHAVGGTLVVMERFDAEEFLDTISRFAVTHTQVVPTMFVRLVKLPEAVRKAADVSTLRTVIHAAAPCPVPVKQEMLDWFGPVIHEYYAGTEGNGFVYADPTSWLAHPGTVGRALNCTLHIVGDDGHELPPGERGTVYFEGGATFEYHNDPDKTARSRHPNGWSTLGDIGYLDGDGFLFLTDRAAYTIISGGVNVYPQEAENRLVTHPGVVDVAVFGVPDDDLGEEVKAVVQPVELPADPDAAASFERQLITYCRETLAAVKCPRSIDFRAELPRHPTGKLYKRLLRDEYWQAAGRAI